MTQDGVRVAVSSILTDLGYTAALDQFSFDLQPSQGIDQCFRVTLARTGTVPELGLGQIEEHRMELWLARQAGGMDATDGCRSLSVDLEALESTLVRATLSGDTFNLTDDEATTEVQHPGGDYVVGMLAVGIDFDRTL